MDQRFVIYGGGLDLWGRIWMRWVGLALVGVVFHSQARADSPAPPYSYETVSADGRYVFVMIAPWPVDEEVKHWNDEWSERIRAVRGRYSRSGLYANDGSTTAIWMVDWYAYAVDVASDGVHLVRQGRSASSMDTEAFSFFANGRLVREVRIGELVDFPWMLRHSVSHVMWSQGGHLDDAALRYSVSTMDGNSFIFNAASGEMIYAARPARMILRNLVLAILIVAGGVVWWMRKRRKVRRVERSTVG